MSYREISAKELEGNIIKNIAEEWMLISAGDQSGYNMMTASWGFAGEMWGHDEIMVVVRPQRYTMEFIEKNDYFAVSFYGDNKDIHKVCGSMSGRDVNKTELAGLTPIFDEAAVYFGEARAVIICKKEYVGRLDESGFKDSEILERWYKGDLHNMIFGKIEKVLIRE